MPPYLPQPTAACSKPPMAAVRTGQISPRFCQQERLLRGNRSSAKCNDPQAPQSSDYWFLAAQGFFAAQGFAAQGLLAAQGFFAAHGFAAHGLAAQGFMAAGAHLAAQGEQGFAASTGPAKAILRAPAHSMAARGRRATALALFFSWWVMSVPQISYGVSSSTGRERRCCSTLGMRTPDDPFVYEPSTVRLTQMQGALICYKLALAQRTLTYCYALTSAILRAQAAGYRVTTWWACTMSETSDYNCAVTMQPTQTSN